ncbi:hypothetical protein [Oceaniovalibus guishaninsula]|nr:hypothetical protein [Oceaniovalibus guishaninsula]
MFTIEHDFDATIVTLVDDPARHRQEDVTVSLFAECITVAQYDPRADRVTTITLSLAQVRDLRAALDLPEGSYRIAPQGRADAKE